MSVGCLRAREVIGFDTCPELGPGCIYPYIGHLDESTKLIVIRRMRAPPVLFYGHPVDLHQSGKYVTCTCKVLMYEICSLCMLCSLRSTCNSVVWYFPQSLSVLFMQYFCL